MKQVSIDRDAREIQVQHSDDKHPYTLAYDKLILAPGARPFVPPIDNIDAANVLTLRNLADTDRIKAVVDRDNTKRAVVVGAGFIGLEMVEQLTHRGIATLTGGVAVASSAAVGRGNGQANRGAVATKKCVVALGPQDCRRSKRLKTLLLPLFWMMERNLIPIW